MLGNAHEQDKLKNQRAFAWLGVHVNVSILAVVLGVGVLGDSAMSTRLDHLSGVINGLQRWVKELYK